MPTKTPIPSFLTTARAFYGPAFDHKKEKALARSMAEWAEMDEEKQSSALAHLAFLDLEAQATTERLLVQVRDLLNEVAASLSVALEASLPEEEDEPEPQDVPDDELEDAFDLDELPPMPNEADEVPDELVEEDQADDDPESPAEPGEEG